MTEDSKHCLQCRLVSGGGLIAAGTYVVYHSKKTKYISRHIITAIGCGIGLLGVLRVLALPPFKIPPPAEEQKTEKENENSEYVIGKIPPRFQ